MGTFEVGTDAFCIMIQLQAYGVQEVECDGLNENRLHNVTCLNSWSLAGRIAWEGLGGVAFLEGVCHLGWTWRFQKPMPFLVSSPCLVLMDQVDQLLLQCHACLPAAILLAMMVMDLHSGTVSLNKSFLLLKK